MCGICGIFDMNGDRRVSIASNSSVITNMTNILMHRGPDSQDTYTRDNVSFGFTRLSIVDLEGGMQPIFNEDESIVLICNGEIFNYPELREKMLSKGHRFRTKSDVEVILHLYEEYGTGFVNSLNGQFAFAVFDFNKEQLFCARDHIGIAPFYYTVTDGLFIFGSEIKAILQHPAVKREVDLVALDQMLTFPGIISPRTFFKDIKSLSSGNFILVNRNSEIHTEEYWDLIYPKLDQEVCNMGERYYVEKLDDLITKAVKSRLQSDVPVGFYISGGLDSSIIASKIWKIDKNLRRHSFSIDFTDKDISESKYQRIMANYVDSIHHEKLFQFSDIGLRLRKAIYHSESALKETYNTASMALSELVRENTIKVILTGEGADELFGGYVGYRFDKYRHQQKAQVTRETLIENEIRKTIWGDENFLYEKNYFAYQKIKKKLYSDNIREKFDNIDCLNHPIVNKERITNIDVFNKRSYVDFKLRMSEHLLSDHGDRMAFANSVEARYPFIDKDLVEFAATIPVDLKLKMFEEKYILKRVADSCVPTEIIKRPKFAFVAPGSSDLLKQDIEYVNDLLSYDTIKRQGYFNPDTVESLKRQYLQEDFKLNLPYDSDLLIIVLTMGVFLEQFKMPIYS